MPFSFVKLSASFGKIDLFSIIQVYWICKSMRSLCAGFAALVQRAHILKKMRRGRPVSNSISAIAQRMTNAEAIPSRSYLVKPYSTRFPAAESRLLCRRQSHAYSPFPPHSHRHHSIRAESSRSHVATAPPRGHRTHSVALTMSRFSQVLLPASERNDRRRRHRNRWSGPRNAL